MLTCGFASAERGGRTSRRLAGDLALVLSAAAYFQQAGRPFHWAEALEDAAALEAGRGDLTAAQRYLAEALGGYTALGAAWEVERAGARLRGYGVRPKRAAYPAGPASGWEALTPTEVKVAYLVAEGRSIHGADPCLAHPGQARRPVPGADPPRSRPPPVSPPYRHRLSPAARHGDEHGGLAVA